MDAEHFAKLVLVKLQTESDAELWVRIDEPAAYVESNSAALKELFGWGVRGRLLNGFRQVVANELAGQTIEFEEVSPLPKCYWVFRKFSG